MTEQLNHEQQEIEAFLEGFFRIYYQERNAGQVIALADDQIQCVGLAYHEVACDKEGFASIVQRQISSISHPLEYTISKHCLHNWGNQFWTAVYQADITVHTDNGSKAVYQMRVSLSVGREEDQWKLFSIHVSETPSHQSEARFPAMKLVRKGNQEQGAASQEISCLLGQLFPGGVVATYVNRATSLAAANNQFLRILGYQRQEDYARDVAGSVRQSVHPDDLETYDSHCSFAISTGKHCECEYRLQRRDGRYIWVHDICQKAMTELGEELLVSAVVDITEQMVLRQKLEIDANTDPLTGALNRKGAQAAFEKTMAGADHWAFCMTDLDRFKLVNDLYGHSRGDAVLRYAATQMMRAFSQMGSVCRLGGDEFSVFLPDYDSLDQVKALIDTISREYAELLQELYPEARSTMSFGMVYGQGPRSFEEIYAQADKNLYLVKRTQKGALCCSKLP